jgi:hypothetical protein
MKPTFSRGDRVQYRLDEGGYWKAIVLKQCRPYGELRYLIRVTDGTQAAVPVEVGHEIAVVPARLSKE